MRHTALEPFVGIGAVVLPAPLARTIGVTQVRPGSHTSSSPDARTEAPLYAQLHEKQIGPLDRQPDRDRAAVLRPGNDRAARSREPHPRGSPRRARQARVRAALEALAAGRLNVESIDYEETLFAKAAAASNQSTALFAVISALVGFLFAFNAMLLTVPQRRRLIADLRRDGYTPRTVIARAAARRGRARLVACVLGLALGEELSIHLFHSNPAFLSLAFAVGSERVVSWQSVAIAAGGGMLAAIVAVLSPLRDILSRDPLAAIDGPREGSAWRRDGGATARAALAGLACLGAATAILLAAPDAAIPGWCCSSRPAAGAAARARRRRSRSSSGSRARSRAPSRTWRRWSCAPPRARAVAIAATGAIAVFGSVAIQGAHGDLLTACENAAHDTNASTDVWVSPAGSYNLLNTAPFHAARAGQARAPARRARGAPVPRRPARLRRAPRAG